jgi:hypothetical protein
MDENAREKAFQDTAKRKCCQMKPTGIIKIMPYLHEVSVVQTRKGSHESLTYSENVAGIS